MGDHPAGHLKSVLPYSSHVTIMAAAIATMMVLMVISLEPVRGEKQEVPSSPGSGFDFDDVDSDRSGCVEGTEELQNFRLHVGKILGEALKLNKVERALRAGRITHSADVNGDGRICQCDLLSILLAESNGPGKHQHAFRVYEDGSFFDDVDADDDGVLADVTEKEGMTQKLAKCVPMEQARRIVDAISKLETDDGKLTRGEYLLFLKSTPRASQPTLNPLPASPSSSHRQPQPRFRIHAMPQAQPQPHDVLQPQAPPQLKRQQPTAQRPVPVNLAGPPQNHFLPMTSAAGRAQEATQHQRLENLDPHPSNPGQQQPSELTKQHNEAGVMQQLGQQQQQKQPQPVEDGKNLHENVPSTAHAAADSDPAPQLNPSPERASASQETDSLSEQLADVKSTGQKSQPDSGSKAGSVDQSLENELLENRA